MTQERTPEGAGAGAGAQTAPSEAIELAKAMTQLWQSHRVAVVGAALAQCLAIWLASHPEHEREELIDVHMASVRRMVPIVIEQIAERARKSQ